MIIAVGNVANAAYDSVCPNKTELMNVFTIQGNVVNADNNKPFDFQATRVDGKGPFKFTASNFKKADPTTNWRQVHQDSTIIYDPTNQDPNYCIAQIWYKHVMQFQLNVKPDKYTGKKQ